MRGWPIRRIRNGRALGALALGAVASIGAPAHAAVATNKFDGAEMPATACRIAAQPLAPAAAPTLAASKSGAILGGAVSALDAIRAQQTAPMPIVLASSEPAQFTLSPGAAPPTPVSLPCGGLAATRVASATGLGAPITVAADDPENFLASKRIRIGHTNFDRDWKRVRGENLSAAVARRYLGTMPLSREQSLTAVNRWVNQRIRYAEDRDQYGVGDFWAGAKKTLKTGRGDCEDIALVKMQLLAAAGFPRDDMILTIARDLVRNADHAVLIVRTEAGYRMLDNATDTVLDAAPSHDYRPILSFGSQGSWLHGA